MTLRRMTWVTCGPIFSLVAVCALSALRVSGEAEPAHKAADPDPVGAWRLKCMPPDGKPRECVVTVSRQGAVLQGEYAADGTTRPARKVVFEEGILCLEVDGRFAGQTYALVYKGAPQGNALKGTVRFSFGWASGTFPFEGERIEQEVASAR